MNMSNNDADRLSEIRSFYDTAYRNSAPSAVTPSRHLRSLARRIGVRENLQVLDVACGAGEWLRACRMLGASVHGVDLSEEAIAICKQSLGDGEFRSSPAESLPFEDARFDVVTCLGALEHFVDPRRALAEMARVAKRDAIFLLLVPNADFLTRRLGLFLGTQQIDAKEDVKTLAEWSGLFAELGLEVKDRWRDLHVLAWSWIALGGWHRIPMRAAQALALTFWPLRWQYQVYHLCIRTRR